MKKKLMTCAVLAVLSNTTPAWATEGGGSTYPSGVENFMVAAAPPPGFYTLVYGSYYNTDTLRDNDGNKLNIPGFKVTATAASTRLVWSTTHEVAGGNLLLHTILPLVNLSVTVPGLSQAKTGLGDITLGAGIAWHSEKVHRVLALDIVAPTGGYNKTDLTNIGRNYWSFQPVYTVTYTDPVGLNADAKLLFNLNTKNGDTNYTSGHEFFMDYALGWGLGSGWVAGVSGHVRQQITSDKNAQGNTIANSRAQSMAIGPSLRYANNKGWLITAKLQKEFSARNTTEGYAFWLKSTIPF